MIEANALTLNNLITQTTDKPIVVDFFASWCGACKMFSPLFDFVASSYSDAAEFVKINVDDNLEVANAFKVMTIPTVIVIKNGKIINRNSGVATKDVLVKMFS